MYLEPKLNKMKNIFFFFFTLICFTTYSQRFPDVTHFYGVKGGVNFFNINSDDIQFNSGTGFNAAFARRIPLVEKLEANVFAEYQQSNFSTDAINIADDVSEVEYTLQSIKVGALANFKVYGPHISLVAGPVLQFNGQLKYDDEYESHSIIAGEGDDPTVVTVEDLSKVSGFNFLFAAGITAGHMNYKVYGLYEYGINNFLSSVPTSGSTLNGHIGILTVGAIVYF